MFTNDKQGIYSTASTSGDTIPLGMDVLKDDIELQKSVKKIVSTVAWMLHDRASVEDEPEAKKQRVMQTMRTD